MKASRLLSRRGRRFYRKFRTGRFALNPGTHDLTIVLTDAVNTIQSALGSNPQRVTTVHPSLDAPAPRGETTLHNQHQNQWQHLRQKATELIRSLSRHHRHLSFSNNVPPKPGKPTLAREWVFLFSLAWRAAGTFCSALPCLGQPNRDRLLPAFHFRPTPPAL